MHIVVDLPHSLQAVYFRRLQCLHLLGCEHVHTIGIEMSLQKNLLQRLAHCSSARSTTDLLLHPNVPRSERRFTFLRRKRKFPLGDADENLPPPKKNEGADIFLDFFAIHELQKSCLSIPEKLSDVVSSYQARTSEFLQEEFLSRGALSW